MDQQRLRTVYQQFDAHGSHAMTFDALCSAMGLLGVTATRAKLSQLFAEADRSKRNALSFDEFAAVVSVADAGKGEDVVHKMQDDSNARFTFRENCRPVTMLPDTLRTQRDRVHEEVQHLHALHLSTNQGQVAAAARGYVSDDRPHAHAAPERVHAPAASPLTVSDHLLLSARATRKQLPDGDEAVPRIDASPTSGLGLRRIFHPEAAATGSSPVSPRAGKLTPYSTPGSNSASPRGGRRPAQGTHALEPEPGASPRSRTGSNQMLRPPRPSFHESGVLPAKAVP